MNERRKFPRYSKELGVKMFVHDPAEPSKIANFEARTLDVSDGGFRIESPRKLAEGSIVGFVFDHDVSRHVVSKVGEVRWCNPSEKSACFELGMAVYP
jgi:hypothetical protein